MTPTKGAKSLLVGEGELDCFLLESYQSYFPWCRFIILCVGMFNVLLGEHLIWRTCEKYTLFSTYLKVFILPHPSNNLHNGKS